MKIIEEAKDFFCPECNEKDSFISIRNPKEEESLVLHNSHIDDVAISHLHRNLIYKMWCRKCGFKEEDSDKVIRYVIKEFRALPSVFDIIEHHHELFCGRIMPTWYECKDCVHFEVCKFVEIHSNEQI